MQAPIKEEQAKPEASTPKETGKNPSSSASNKSKSRSKKKKPEKKDLVVALLEEKGLTYDEWIEQKHDEVINENLDTLIDFVSSK